MLTLNLGRLDAYHVDRMLLALHKEQPITAMLFAQGHPFGALFAHGTHPLHAVRRKSWSGQWAIQRGERQPCTGIDLARAVLTDALPLQPRVIVWGLMPAFWSWRKGEVGRRVREWDVSADVLEAEALRFGYEGWRATPDGLRSFGGDTVEACAAESPAT